MRVLRGLSVCQWLAMSVLPVGCNWPAHLRIPLDVSIINKHTLGLQVCSLAEPSQQLLERTS
jgi:hypothetical protein